MFGLPKEIVDHVQKKTSVFSSIYKNCLKVKKEDVIIISDYGQGGNTLATMMGCGYYLAAKEKGLNTTLLFQDVKKGFMQADHHVAAALQRLEKKSIIILSLSNKLGQIGREKSFRGFCQERGHRFISSTGLGDVGVNYFDLFLEAMSVNYSRMQKRGLAIKKLWDKASAITVKTDAGTDITVNVEGKEAVANTGEYGAEGSGGNMPCGEVYIPPKGFEGVNGKIVIDGSIRLDQGALLVDEPLTLMVKQGRVIQMEGKYASLLEKTLRVYQDRARYPHRVRYIGELGIGINPGAVVIGSMIMDEKVLGTGHIAIGSNYWFGGDIKTIFHGDMVFKNPQFYVDGKKMDL